MKKTILIGILVTTVFVAQAQPNRGNPDITPTPFGFIELLIVAGVTFGGKKVYDAKKKNQV